MRECLRLECKAQFEPNKPKQVFCSAKCRVYHSRSEKKKNKKEIPENKKSSERVLIIKERPKPPEGLSGIALRMWKDKHIT